MNTSMIGFWGAVVSSLLVACGSSVEEPTGGDGGGGENEGGSEVGGQGPIGGSDGGTDVGGTDAGGAGEGGAAVGGSGEGGGGEGGAASEACALMEQVSISDPELFDAGGDLQWSPGETATFVVTLTNDASEDNFNYPGAQVTSPLFGIEGGDNTLFGLLAGEPTEVMVSVSASDVFQTGSQVELVFSVTTLAQGCGELDNVGLTVTLE